MIGSLFFPKKTKPRPLFPMGDYSLRLASVDVWIRDKVCPARWSSEQKKTVIQQLRDGKSARQVANATRLDKQDIQRVKRFVSSLDLEEALRKNQSGAVLVEFAIAAVPLLLLMLGGVQYGYAIWQQQVMSFAASAAAKCGAEADRPCPDDASILQYAASLAGYNNAGFEVEHVGCGVQVRGTVVSDLIQNLSFYPSVNIGVTACYPEPKPMFIADLGNCSVDLYGKTRTVRDALDPQWHQPVQPNGLQMVQVICIESKTNVMQDSWVVN